MAAPVSHGRPRGAAKTSPAGFRYLCALPTNLVVQSLLPHLAPGPGQALDQFAATGSRARQLSVLCAENMLRRFKRARAAKEGSSGASMPAAADFAELRAQYFAWHAFYLRTAPGLFALTGARALRRGQLDAAERLSRNALRLDAQAPVAAATLGAVCAQRGDWPAAEVHLHEACLLERDNVQLWMSLAGAHVHNRHVASAAHALGVAVGLAPNDPHVHVLLGNALASAGRPLAAMAHYAHATSLSPELPEAHHNLVCLRESVAQRDALAVGLAAEFGPVQSDRSSGSSASTAPSSQGPVYSTRSYAERGSFHTGTPQ